MGIFDIFRKRSTISQQVVDVKLVTEYKSLTDDKFERSRQLLKEATSLKDTNIEQAISAIEQAIRICPEHVMSDYFKLSHYHHLAGNIEKAYTTHKDLLTGLDIEDIGMYNMRRSQVFNKLCTLAYKDKNYGEYLYYYCSWLYNTVIAMACQGRKSELFGIMDNEDKLCYLAPTKVNSSFKKLGKESNKEIFNDTLIKFFDTHRNTVTIMSEKAYQIDNDTNIDSYRVNESIGQRSNRLLKKCEDFMAAYRSLNDEQFVNFFESSLRPIILD